MNIILGTIDTFANFETLSLRTNKLDTYRIVVVYVKGSDNRPYATIYDIDVNGNRTHVVTQLLWDQDVGGDWNRPIDSCQVDTNKFIVSYVNPTGTREARARLLTVSDSTITEHGQLLSGYVPRYYITVEQIALNKIVYSSSRWGVNASSIIATCSGTVLTWGSQAAGEFTSGNSTLYIRNTKLADNKWVVNYTDGGNLYGTVGTTGSGYDAAGRVAQYGTEYLLDNADAKYTDACSPATDKFVVTYRNHDTGEGCFIVCTVLGYVITWGSPIVFANNSYNTACCPYTVNADHIVLSYVDIDDGLKGKIKLYEINWSAKTASLITAETFELGSTGGGQDLGLDIVLVNSNSFQIGYQDDDDNDYGKIIAGNIIILITPTITGVSGDSQNTINISEIPGSTKYNIYWSLTPGVTIENGTKIEDVSRLHEHIDLIKQNYYYIATAENEVYESDPSNEICLKPDFEGKIFNHTTQMKNNLLYQYQGD